MSNYRRLISYIYAYEGGVKGKNIGYAKVEVRGDQCRIQVNVKKIYVGSNDIGVYLLSSGPEIMLGNIFIRSGAGEFRVTVQAQNVEGSGYSMDQCYGLTVHDVESTWQCYTTIWEDAVAQAAELDAGDVTEKSAELELADVTAQNARAKEASAQKSHELTEGEAQTARFPVSAEIERELSAEELRLSAVAPWEKEEVPPKEKTLDDWLPEPVEMRNYIGELADSVVEESMDGLEECMKQPNPEPKPGPAPNPASEPKPEVPPSSAKVVQEAIQQAFQALVGGIMTGAEKAAVRAEKPEIKAEKEAVRAAKTVVKAEQPAVGAEQPVTGVEQLVAPISQESLPELEDPIQLDALDRMEKEAVSQNLLWNQLENRYPKVLAFDYEQGCEILSIKPQDIGLLPREAWVYGNNSFLLHGYYNYRHLILAKLENPTGRPRYLLGVPGHYFSNEKYMATMFGFPYFVLAKRQPEGDGRYGYWYTDLKLE